MTQNLSIQKLCLQLHQSGLHHKPELEGISWTETFKKVCRVKLDIKQYLQIELPTLFLQMDRSLIHIPHFD